MSDERLRPPSIDSRRWTGLRSGVTQAERRAAWHAFRAAGGPGAIAARRAAAIVSAAGVTLAAPAMILMSDDGGAPVAIPLRDMLVRLHPGLPYWLTTFVGPALAVAVAASTAGVFAACRHRDALTRGFAAAPLPALEAGRGDALISLAAFAFALRTRAPSVAAVAIFWMMAYFLARATAMQAERVWGLPRGRRSDMARLALTCAAMIGLLIATTI